MVDDLIKKIRTIKENKSKYDPEVVNLISRINSSGKTDSEWKEVKNDVKKYLKSDASEENKKELLKYTETLLMIS